MGRPLLSLAMMVKNEERFLEDALLSALDWVDEMIVVDTGSTDRTVEIAKDLGATVSFFPWQNDFSSARNETIRRATGDWVAILDADERFVGRSPERIKDLLVRTDKWPYQAFLLNVVNQKLDGTPTHSFYNPRIFPRHPDIGYVGRIHNCFGSISKGTDQDFKLTRCEGLEIIHLGYDAEIYRERKKIERNITLLEAAVHEEPEEPRYRFYLGREYIVQKRYAEANRMLKTVLDEGDTVDRLLSVEAQVTYLQCLNHQHAPLEERVSMAVKILEEHPNEADTWFYLSIAYHENRLHAEAAEALEEGLKSIDSNPQLQTCRLAAVRAEREMALGEYYTKTGEDERAKKYIYASWEHSTLQDPDRFKILKLVTMRAHRDGDDEVLSQSLPELASYGAQVTPMFPIILEGISSRKGSKRAKRTLKKLGTCHPTFHQNTLFQSLISQYR